MFTDSSIPLVPRSSRNDRFNDKLITKFMDKTLGAIQIIISVLLILSILFQNKGAGLGETFGGGGGGGNVYQTKRGFDKFLFAATIVLAILFLGTAFLSFVQK